MNQNSKKILAIVQARFTSSRLPGKVMSLILNEPMLFRQLERIHRSKFLSQAIVATSVDKSDDILAEHCKQRGIACFRGSLEDVLDRFYRAACVFSPDHVVRITGDCPLLDPQIIDSIVSLHLDQSFDYTTNIVERTFPDGMDVEIMTFRCLKAAWENAALPSEREHVTPYIYHHSELFKIGHFKQADNLSQVRLTVDETEDLNVIREIFENLYPKNKSFTLQDILGFLAVHPEIAKLNRKFQINEGYQKSLENDAVFLSGVVKQNR